MKKKLLAMALCGTMVMSMAACGGASADTAEAPADAAPAAEATEDVSAPAEAAAPSGDAHYTIGICQLVQHESLDAATQGFQDALIEELGEDAVTFDLQNASGDSATCATIVNGFVSNGVDLIMANATPALQAAVAATADIPIVGTSVTDYGVALEIEGFDGLVGTNVSGTTDIAPLDQQAVLLNQLYNNSNKVGLLYCSAEANSQYQVDQIVECLENMDYEYELYTFADSNDLASVCTKAVEECDVIYVPTDNTVASNTELVNNICAPAGIPVISGFEESTMGLATLAINYYDLGVVTGKMAAKILTGEANVSEMPIEYAPDITRKYNPSKAEELGITIPDDYVAIETE